MVCHVDFSVEAIQLSSPPFSDSEIDNQSHPHCQCNGLVCVKHCRIDDLDERNKHMLVKGSGLDAELFI